MRVSFEKDRGVLKLRQLTAQLAFQLRLRTACEVRLWLFFTAYEIKLFALGVGHGERGRRAANDQRLGPGDVRHRAESRLKRKQQRLAVGRRGEHHLAVDERQQQPVVQSRTDRGDLKRFMPGD